MIDLPTLEVYAQKVREADAALLAQDALDNNEKYRALLAQTDDAEGMNQLHLEAVAARDTLARSVQEAIQIGQTLRG